MSQMNLKEKRNKIKQIIQKKNDVRNAKKTITSALRETGA